MKILKRNCVYCMQPEIKKRKIVENKLVFAFPTNIPIVPGHTLIAPQRCVARYENLTIKEKEAIEKLRTKIKKALIKTFGAEGFHYAWNENEIGGQSIRHFHLHVIPRKKGDTGITKYEPRKFLYRPGSREPTPEKELLKISQIIKRNIS